MWILFRVYKYFDAGRQSVYRGHNLDVEMLLARSFELARHLTICHYIEGNDEHNRRCGADGMTLVNPENNPELLSNVQESTLQ
ncbi:hypothetical protein CYMTET_17137 [Cymbomonas tetramitiformis]|uniref:Uncharacterized protein n=1 Tax=Cymbomonas tetramitiformis TaxID=36881 RepID=A0AAE0GB68_9CHLO|nr:hypothetical protein CYMTET_17137 [Cymbomonas tetramitiformis]